jgi:hypothetical protein
MWAVMSSERTKEEIMKKLAIIGIAVLGLSLVIAVSPAGARSGMTKAEYRALMLRSEALNRLYQAPGKPALMSLPEYRALMLRSEGLNKKYGVVQVRGENFYARGFAASPDDNVPVKGENYFANGLPTSTPAVASSDTTAFEWGNVGIGVAGLLGLIILAGGVIGLHRHRLHPRTS